MANIVVVSTLNFNIFLFQTLESKEAICSTDVPHMKDHYPLGADILILGSPPHIYGEFCVATIPTDVDYVVLSPFHGLKDARIKDSWIKDRLIKDRWIKIKG